MWHHWLRDCFRSHKLLFNQHIVSSLSYQETLAGHSIYIFSFILMCKCNLHTNIFKPNVLLCLRLQLRYAMVSSLCLSLLILFYCLNHLVTTWGLALRVRATSVFFFNNSNYTRLPSSRQSCSSCLNGINFRIFFF